MLRYLDKSWKVSKFLKSLENLEKSWKSWKVSKILKSLKNLEKSQKSWQSLFVSTISINISTKINLDWKISIWKISTEKKKSWSRLWRKSWHFKKVSLDTKDILDLDLDWSWLSRPPGLHYLHNLITILNLIIFKLYLNLNKFSFDQE
jgi:hypothetical protein